jgi:hypothetical protein
VTSKGAEVVTRGLELWGAGRSEAARRGGGAAGWSNMGRKAMSLPSWACMSERGKGQDT